MRAAAASPAPLPPTADADAALTDDAARRGLAWRAPTSLLPPPALSRPCDAAASLPAPPPCTAMVLKYPSTDARCSPTPASAISA